MPVPDYLDDGDPWAAPIAQGTARAYSDAGYAQPRRELDSEEFMAPPAPLEPKPVKAKAYKPLNPLDTPEYKDAALRRKQLHDTEQLYLQRLKDFDATEGAGLKMAKNPDTLKKDAVGFRADTAPLVEGQNALLKVLGDNAGDAAYRTPVSGWERALRQTRQRIADEAARVRNARVSYDEQTFVPLRNRLTSQVGGPAAPTPSAPQGFLNPQDDVDYLAARGQPAPRSAGAPNFTQPPAGTESAGEPDRLGRDGEDTAPAAAPDFLDDAEMAPQRADDLKAKFASASPLGRLKMMFGSEGYGQTEVEGALPMIGSEVAGTRGGLATIPRMEGDSALAGGVNAVNAFTSGLTTPENAAIAAATGGLGEVAALGGTVGKVAQGAKAAALGGFAAEMGSQVPQQVRDAYAIINDPKSTDAQITEALVTPGLNTLMTALAAHGAVGETARLRSMVRERAAPTGTPPVDAVAPEEGHVVEDRAPVVEQPDLSRLTPDTETPVPPATSETPAVAESAAVPEAPAETPVPSLAQAGKPLPPDVTQLAPKTERSPLDVLGLSDTDSGITDAGLEKSPLQSALMSPEQFEANAGIDASERLFRQPKETSKLNFQKEFDARFTDQEAADRNYSVSTRKLLDRGLNLRRGHEMQIKLALDGKNPVNASAIDTYGIALPDGYVKEGDQYIYRPTETEPVPTSEPAPAVPAPETVAPEAARAAEPISSETKPPETAPTGEPTDGYQRSERTAEQNGRPDPSDGLGPRPDEPADVRPDGPSGGEQPRGGAGGGDVPVPGRAGPADADLGQPGDAGGALTEGTAGPGRGPVGIKNESVEQLRKAFGLDPAEARSGTTNEQALEGAAATLARDPGAARALVADFNERPRALTPEENLLVSHEINRIRVERDAIRVQQDEAARTGDEDTLATLDKRAQALGEEFDRVGSVADRTGTLQSSALRTRQAMLNEDYSLAELERQQRVSNRSEPITPDQQERINKLHADYQTATKALEATRATLDTERAARAAELAVQEVLRRTSAAPAQKSPPSRIRQYIRDQAEQARERFAREGGFSSSVVGEEGLTRRTLESKIKDASFIAADMIADGLDASVELVKRFGKAIEPHIAAILKEAKNAAESIALDRDVPAERRSTTEAIKARLADGDSISDLGHYVNRLAEQHVRQGITSREPLLDAIHADLKEIDPKITRRQAMDALSGYGQTTTLNTEPAKVTLRDLKGQMQQVAKLEDMQGGRAPAKTGPERRVPSDEERRLIKQVEEAKKKGGYAVTDPATQLKSSLSSIKTRLSNQIKDLDFQIATGKKTVKSRTPAPSDAETAALVRRRDELKALFDETFPPAPPTAVQRAQQVTDSLNRRIEEVQRQIRTTEVFPAGKKPAVSTPAVDALRQRLTDLQAERQNLRDSLQPPPEPQPRSELTDAQRAKLATKALQRSIEDYTARINEGAFQRRTNAPKAPRTAELDALRERRDALKAQFDALKALAEPDDKTEAQIRQDAYKASLARQLNDLLDHERRQQRGDFTPKFKAPPLEMTPEITAAKADVELAKGRVHQNQQLEDRRNRTTSQKIKDVALDVLNVPRSVMTSMDLSAVLRQGSVIGFGNPRMAAKSIGPMLKALMSERNAAIVEQEIAGRPNAPRYKESKLYLAPKDDVVMTHREETMRSNLAEKIPGLGRGVKASQRAYVAYLNKLRADSFDSLTSALEGDGKRMTSDEAKAVANYVNVATGRGELGRYSGAAEALSTIMFSPRLLASRFQVLAGQPIYRAAKASPRVRNAIAGEYAKYLAGLGTVVALGGLAGASIEKDPRSSDFGKLKFGNTRIDVMGGLSQNAVLLSRLFSGSTKNEIGDTKSLVAEDGKSLRYGDASIAEVLGNFGRSKLAPVPGAALDIRQGSNMVGEKVTPLGALGQMLMPLSISPKDIQAIMQEHGVAAGTAIELLNLLGAGVQHYENRNPGVRPEAAQAARDAGQKFPTAPRPKPVDPRRPYTDDEIKQYKREVDEQVSAGLIRDAARLRALPPEQAKARLSAIASDARVQAEARLRMRHR